MIKLPPLWIDVVEFNEGKTLEEMACFTGDEKKELYIPAAAIKALLAAPELKNEPLLLLKELDALVAEYEKEIDK